VENWRIDPDAITDRLAAMIGTVLSEVLDKVGGICMKQLSRYNVPLIMATAGFKGPCYTRTMTNTLITTL